MKRGEAQGGKGEEGEAQGGKGEEGEAQGGRVKRGRLKGAAEGEVEECVVNEGVDW